MVKRQEIDQYLLHIIQEFKAIGFPVPEEKIDKTVGYSSTTTKFGMCKKRNGRFTIYLSRYALNNTEIVKDTLVHEVIHTLPGADNHGADFKQYASIVNKKLGYHIKCRGSREEAAASGLEQARRERFKYKLVCQKCGSQILRQRRTKLVQHPEHYRCVCGGAFDKIY